MVVLGQFLTRYLVVLRDFYRTSTMAAMAAWIPRTRRSLYAIDAIQAGHLAAVDGNLATRSNSSETPST